MVDAPSEVRFVEVRPLPSVLIMVRKRKKITDLVVATKYVTLARNAQTRGIDVTISFAELKRVLKQTHCYFTGVELNDINEDENQFSLDRIDNDKGYVKGNVVACARSFNQFVKGGLTVQQIKHLYNGLEKAGLCK